MQWMIDNKEWLFSGIGVFIITVVISIFTNKTKSIKPTLFVSLQLCRLFLCHAFLLKSQ